MSYRAIARRALCACAAVGALFSVAPAAASASTTTALTGAATQLAAEITTTATASCTAPALTTPFAALGDLNSYALLPGESADNFTGSGWLLSGGAKIVTTTLADGTKGSVLDLPSGAAATSPPTCVTNNDPTARTMLHNLAGSAGVGLYVAYLSANPSLVSTGTITGSRTAWTLTNPISISPTSATGWQLAWFVLIGTGSGSTNQLYNFYIDPRQKA